MRVTLVAACALNGVIGRGGQLPWRLSGDLKRFKALTMGHVLVMGRRTWESIGRPLPGRRTLVVTRTSIPGIETFDSLASALEAARLAPEVFLVGGAAIYREGLAFADRIHLTWVLAQVDGDVQFPEVDWSVWHRVAVEPFPASSGDEYPCQVEIFERYSRS